MVYSLGDYRDAIKKYELALSIIEDNSSHDGFLAKVFGNLYGEVCNQIALCCLQDLDTRLVVQYCSKTIAMKSNIKNKSILVQAYVRRGEANELLEKFWRAKDDMLAVKALDHENMLASQCLNRLSAANQVVYGLPLLIH